MKLETTTIVGLPLRIARDLMRHLNVSSIDEETVLDFLNKEHWRSTVDAACKANPRIPKILRQRSDADDRQDYCKIWRFKFKPIKAAEAKRVLAALIAEGYLEPHEPEYKGDKAKWQTSQKGRQVAAASLTKRFDRATADKEIAALIKRAKQINARDELVMFVHKITAFGSYLTESNDLGDIDLVVELAPRRSGKHTDESHYRARNSGKTLDFMASLCFGDSEVMQLLRARKTRLSFCSTSLLNSLDTEFKVIFEWGPDAERRAEMEAFDWRLHEPLRQVNDWLTSNHGLNAEPVEIARWCQDVAAILSKTKNWQLQLFRDWSDNAAHELLSYWGVPPSQAAAEIAHWALWDDYRKYVALYDDDFQRPDGAKPANALIEAEIYSHFARGTDGRDAAILVAKHFGWKFIKQGDWVSPLARRIMEVDQQDPPRGIV